MVRGECRKRRQKAMNFKGYPHLGQDGYVWRGGIMRKKSIRETRKITAVVMCAMLLWGCKGETRSVSRTTESVGTMAVAESDGQDEDGTKREADESAGIKAQTPGQGKEAAHGVTRSNDYVTRHAAQGTDTDFKPVDQNDVLAGDDSVPEDFYSLATDLPASKVEQFAKKVKQQLMIQDWDALSGELSYPVTVDGVIYDTPEEFLAADFGADLNPYFFVELEEETCSRMFCNWSGIMLGKTGRVWVVEALNDDLSSQGLKVRAINGLNESFGLPGEVSMSADESDITPTSMKLLLENETDLDIVFGDDFRLQKHDGESWVDMEPLLKKDGIYFHSIAYKPRRGNPVEWTVDWESLYGGLEEGTYAITKSVKDVNGTAGYTDFERTFSFTINP